MKKRITIATAIVLITALVLQVGLFFYYVNENTVKQHVVHSINSDHYQVIISGKIRAKLWHGLAVEVNGMKIMSRYGEVMNIGNLSCQFDWFRLLIGTYKIKRISLNSVNINTTILPLQGMILNDSAYPIVSNINRISIKNISFTNKILTRGFAEIYNTSTGSNLTMSSILNHGQLGNTNINIHTVFTEKIATILQLPATLILKQFNLTAINNKFKTNLSTNHATYNNKQLFLQNIVGDISIDGQDLSFTMSELRSSMNFTDINCSNIKLITHQQSKRDTLDVLADIRQLVLSNSVINASVNSINVHAMNHQIDLLINLSGSIISAGKEITMHLIGSQLIQNQKYSDKHNSDTKLQIDVNSKESVAIVMINSNYLHISNELQNILSVIRKAAIFNYINLLSNITIKGQIVARELLVNNFFMQNLNTNFVIQNRSIIFSQLAANIYGGMLTGWLKIVDNGGNYDIHTVSHLNNINLQNALHDLFNINTISGVADTQIFLDVYGVNHYSDIMQKMNGKVTINAYNGAFAGIDVALLNNLLSSNILANKHAIFQKLTACLDFKHGVSENSIINFSSSNILGSGTGNIDLLRNLVQCIMKIRTTLPNNSEKIHAVLVPIEISGSLLNPDIHIIKIYLFAQNKHSANQPITTNKNLGHRIKEELLLPGKKLYKFTKEIFHHKH